MRRIVIAAATLAALGAAPVLAQHNHGGGMATAPDLSVLPAVCQQALHGADLAPMMPDMAMGAMPMGDAQKASYDAMLKMTGPMMATHAIADPDLAFNCGMIAHHQGAIDMANAVLRYGKDPATKQMAERIVEAQQAEIKEMTARAEQLAAQ